MKSYRCYFLDGANVAHDSCDVMASCDGIAICLAIIALSKQRPGIKFVEVWCGTRMIVCEVRQDFELVTTSLVR